MKIVVLDGYTMNPGDLSWKPLEEIGELIVYPRSKPEEVQSRIRDAEIVLTNKTVLDAKIIKASPALRYIGVLATGYNVVDLAAAQERAICVTNIPDYSTGSVAQMVFALLLEICNHVGAHSQAVYSGTWSQKPDFCFWDHPILDLAGKTMGIIGYGLIGQSVARIARAFGMQVLIHAPRRHVTLEDTGMRYGELDEVLSEADVVSLHCPLRPETAGLIDRKHLDLMKRTAILINTARGPLVVEEDLRDALNEGRIYAAGLDVVSTEPIRPDNPLLYAKNCFITPHIAWASQESRRRLMTMAADNIQSFLEGKSQNRVYLA